jgi:hypothetical protein
MQSRKLSTVRDWRTWIGIAGGVAACSVALISVSGLTAWGNASAPQRVEPAPWQGPIAPMPKGVRVFRLSITAGYCAGEQPPEIDHIDVTERRTSVKKPFKSAIITTFLRFPTSGEVGSLSNLEKLQQPCADIGLRLRRVIKLKRPVRDLVLFDGSYSPPRRVWPPLR